MPLSSLKARVVLATTVLLFAFVPAFASDRATRLMFEAVRNGDQKALRTAISEGADVNARDGTALAIAAVLGNTDVVRTLINAGADVNASVEDGFTALHCCVFASDPSIKVLLKELVGIETYGNATDLYSSASTAGDIVKMLIKAGADVNAQSDAGLTALMFAATYGNINIVKELINAGANVNMQDIQGATALTYGVLNKSTVDALIKAGADVNIRNNYGGTALMFAASGGNADSVKAIIDAGADVNVQNFIGLTALSLAKDPDIIRMLKTAGARQ